jgi:hypothetical protein
VSHSTDRTIGRWLFALTLGVYMLTAGGSLTTSDAVQAFDLTRNLVEHGSIAISEDLVAGAEALRGPDGRYYSPFGIIQSIVNVPFYLAGKAATRIAGVQIGKPDTVPKAAVALAQTLVGAVVVWQIFRLCLAVTGAAGVSLAAALTFAFGSVLWPYSRFGFNQPIACAALTAAVHTAWLAARRSQPRWSAAAGLWLGVALLTRHELALALLPVGAWLWWAGRPSGQERRTRLLAFLPPFGIALAVWLALNAYRFGNPLDTGHLRDPVPGFGSPVIEGLLGLAFSPSTSLFLYSPVAIFGLAGLAGPLWRRDRATAGWLVAIVALFTIFYASLGNWTGGRSYGSRYLVIVLPLLAVGWAALLAALDRRVRRTLAVSVLTLGVIVQLPGVLVDYAKVSQAASSGRGPFTSAERQWSWAASPLVLNARAAAHAVPANAAYLLGWKPVPAVARPANADDRGFSQQFAFSLDFWWLYLWYVGVLPRWGIVALLAAGAGWTLLCTRGTRGVGMNFSF